MNEDMESKEREIKQNAVKQAREILEQCGFDAVVVIGSWQTEDGATAAVKANSGNWYAQLGLMRFELDCRTQSAFIEEKQREV